MIYVTENVVLGFNVYDIFVLNVVFTYVFITPVTITPVEKRLSNSDRIALFNNTRDVGFQY